ncbi:hypothetical protein [Rhodopseudomonas sp. P2A-2r]|uniref:hypothetical protein n=1 Tax=unclassified Rhodopseudomonas TaxID=2638247 RepID=UPI0022346F54|nr:hypothetical protein [Rhodopseudomonas sp. P2A-2r]UZE47839.1 hypothetical protein ONR75_23635 [Rhodopseudomonas sp. P2A-2r]
MPYILEAETVEVSPGLWCSHVSYPELPGCAVQAFVVEDALRQLERLRIETIVAMVASGQMPPLPRPPLQHCDPVWVAAEAGVQRELIAQIAQDAPSSGAAR